MENGLKILEKLKKEIPQNEYNRYIKNLEFDQSSSRSDILIYNAPNILSAKWIKTKYAKKIAHLYEVESGINAEIIIGVKNDKNSQNKIIPKRKQTQSDSSTLLNPSFTFETFVTGESNELAFNVAKSVALNPGEHYNPLFIYGGVGLGKTHIMQAIGNYRLKEGDKVIYNTFEQFMNRYITHIRSNTMDRFREYYRNCDILLIDDIQFISRKEQTQDEFFHTFNELHSLGKQIVITSDRPPKKIAGLVDRLKSRFEWGMLANINPPGLETKIAIIKKKAIMDGIRLDEEVVNYLASNLGINIREIEGTIIRLNAMSNLLRQPITLEFAKNAISDYMSEKKNSITIDDIIEIVSSELNIKPSDIKSKKRAKKIVEARRISIYLARNLTPNSMPQIAVYFGMKDHSAISHTMRKIEEIIAQDENLKVLIEELSNKIETFKSK
jgi:chromosomal replication initiator protein